MFDPINDSVQCKEQLAEKENKEPEISPEAKEGRGGYNKKEYREELEEIKGKLPKEIQEFAEIFSTRKYQLPEHGPYDMEIRLKEGAKLPRVGQRRFTREEAIEIKKQLNELGKAGKIQKSISSHDIICGKSGQNETMVYGP